LHKASIIIKEESVVKKIKKHILFKAVNDEHEKGTPAHK